jgi:MFS family permease
VTRRAHQDLNASAGGGVRAAARTSTTLAPLRHASFARLLVARWLSMLGSRVALVTLVLYVSTDVGGPGAVGAVLAAYAGPLVLLLIVGGVWADRLPRQRLMAATDLIRCGLHSALAALILTGTATVPAIAGIGILFGASEALSRPAASGITPQTVPEPLIQRANAMLTLADNIADFAGPVLATTLVATVGAGYAFAFDAATFLASAVLVASIRLRPRGRPAGRLPLTTQLVEGLRVLRSRPWILLMLLTASGVLLTGMAPWMVAGPTRATEGYGSASVFGLLSGSVGLGMVLGALAGSHWRPRAPLTTSIAGLAIWPLFMGMFALAAPLPAVLALSLLAGAAVSLANIWWETTLAEQIPPHALSRVAAWDWLVSLGLLPLGYLAAGPAAAALGSQAVVLGGAVICLLTIAVALRPASTGALGPSDRGSKRGSRPRGGVGVDGRGLDGQASLAP